MNRFFDDVAVVLAAVPFAVAGVSVLISVLLGA